MQKISNAGDKAPQVSWIKSKKSAKEQGNHDEK